MGYDVGILSESGVELGAVSYGDLDNYYALPGDRRCPMTQQIAWCRACDAFVAAERVPSADEAREMIAMLERGPEALAEWFRRDGVPEEQARRWGTRLREPMLERWRLVLEWTLLRTSPAKCLRCGATDILPVRERAGARHPVTDEPLHFRTLSHYTAYRCLYDVEGTRLRG